MESMKSSREAQLARERELAAVKVSKDDVATLVAEFDLENKAADRLLREQGGSLEATIKHLLNNQLPTLKAKAEERKREGKKAIYV